MLRLYRLDNSDDKRVGGGTFDHPENGVFLQKIQDITLIIITKKELHTLLK